MKVGGAGWCRTQWEGLAATGPTELHAGKAQLANDQQISRQTVTIEGLKCGVEMCMYVCVCVEGGWVVKRQASTNYFHLL